MKFESNRRYLKRQQMKKHKATFTERVQEAIRNHQRVRGINWTEAKPEGPSVKSAV
jgi:hypothetical protein